MKFESIQALRAFAANAVVAAHLTEIERKYGAGVKLLPDWVGVQGAALGVNLFFVISGFVIAIVAHDARWRSFLGARFIRIYPIYWFYTTIVLIALSLRPDIVNQSYVHPPSIIKSYLLWPEDTYPLLGVGWTLIHEMYFYVVIAAAIALSARLTYVLSAWSMLILAVPFLMDVSGPVAAVVFHPLTLEFIAGAGVGLIIQHGETRFARTCLCSGIGLLIVGCFSYHLGFAPADDRWARTIDLGLPFVAVVYGVAAMESRKAWRIKAWPIKAWRTLPWMSSLGDASYSTYLSHVMTISVLGRWFMAQPVHDTANEIAFVAVCLIAANLTGLLSFRYLERPVLTFLRERIRSPKLRAA